MGDFLNFVEDLNAKMGIALPSSWSKLGEIEIARRFLARLNEYFYQTYEGIGSIRIDDEEFRYFSEFHKFWEKHHDEVLNVRVDDGQAAACAEVLHAALSKHGSGIFRVEVDTRGLSVEAVAQVRFFTANQDFREPPKGPYQKYHEDPGQFEAGVIADDPEGFLNFLGFTSLSQTDKRRDFARNAAKFLLDRNIRAFGIAAYYNNDAAKIREALISAGNTGYGYKKVDMFLRDMVDLGVWPKLANMDQIDVAPDINTVKVALRTGILKSDIPLISSFLDIFCHQYGDVCSMAAMGWRGVWEHWRMEHPKTAPPSPCMMDSLLYRIGREYCSDGLVEYHCSEGHKFFHFGGGLRKCKLCSKSGTRSAVVKVARFLPCQVDKKDLPREGGEILCKSRVFRAFAGTCVFEDVCQPRIKGFVPLDPPKSISIKGQTGWTSAYADREKGGGGLMS